MKSIALLACWYGQYPEYLPYFMHSCSFNETIDFIIITDNNEGIPNKPNNLIIFKKSVQEIKNIAFEKLGFNLNIGNPYKFCDIKPVYGLIFSDILNNYDFWGHIDLDIIWGNIRKFITPNILRKYDFVNARHDYVTGFFALYKNTLKMNTIFMKSKDHKMILKSSKHYCFDECNFRWFELMQGKDIFTIKSKIESMTHVILKQHKLNLLKAYFNFIIAEGTPGEISFNNGTILYKNKYEVMLYHLRMFKLIYSQKSNEIIIPNKYFISSDEIIL